MAIEAASSALTAYMAGIIGGVLMMVIAVVWFFVGLAAGFIFFYPPILFVVGIVAFVKGLVSRR